MRHMQHMVEPFSNALHTAMLELLHLSIYIVSYRYLDGSCSTPLHIILLHVYPNLGSGCSIKSIASTSVCSIRVFQKSLHINVPTLLI